jgi:hypothetical protein
MPDFTFKPTAAISPGFLAIAPPAAGSTTRPPRPGSIVVQDGNFLYLYIEEGMLPMKFEAQGGGGRGQVNVTGTAGGGGGGGGFISAYIPEGAIAYGAQLAVVAGYGAGQGTNHRTSGSTGQVYLRTGGAPFGMAWGGSGPSSTAAPRGGGGVNPGFPLMVSQGAVAIEITNGHDGTAGGAGVGGDGGAGGGPDAGVGGVGSATHVGNDGAFPGGGGGGTTTIGGAPAPGKGGNGWIRLTWPYTP